MKVYRIDHVGIIVNDLAAAKAFFLDLGLELEWEGEVEGEVEVRYKPTKTHINYAIFVDQRVLF
jgi:catechol 2,3-dioxygenase-like lactoylglutathione lyase family enzyme